MKKTILFLLCAIALMGCGRSEENESGGFAGILENGALDSKSLVAADFNSGAKPNNLGGNFGAWDKDPADASQVCKDAFDGENRYGEDGFGLKLYYDVDSDRPAYNGFWMLLQGLDASGYDSISFWVRGDKGAGYTTKFKVELKNAGGETASYYVANVTDSWQNMLVPFAGMRGMKDFSALKEFVIVFEDRAVSKKTGVIYIDDIAFTRNR